ncbi:hypothetical protein [Ureaplasma canigenitalium]|uniref:hypothetical protein n=1 Tax=Ureaplasma canigenitalium TaxID=42092 RepID=UPI000AFC0C5D|nr:hypothetical protein [Ureaplasma canigenitalium]
MRKAIKLFHFYRQNYIIYYGRVNSVFNMHYKDNKSYFFTLNHVCGKEINKVLGVVKINLDEMHTLLKNMRSLANSYAVIAFKKILKETMKLDQILRDQTKILDELLYQFWNDFYRLDQIEYRLIAFNNEINNLNNKVKTKFNYECKRWMTNELWIIDLFETMMKAKIKMNGSLYSEQVYQIAHRISNKCWIINNFSNVFNQVFKITNANKENIKNINQQTFLTEEEKNEIVKFNISFEKYLNDTLNNLLQMTKFKTINSDLSMFMNQSISYYNISSSNYKGALLYEKYLYKFKDDFEAFPYRLGEIRSIIVKIDEELKYYSFNDLNDMILGVIKNADLLEKKFISKDLIGKNMDFINQSKIFYEQFLNFLNEIHSFIAILKKYNSDYGNLVHEIVELLNLKNHLFNYLESINPGQNRDLLNSNWLEDDKKEIDEYFLRSKSFDSEFDVSYITDSKHHLRYVKTIRERLSYIINYLFNKDSRVKRLYKELMKLLDFYQASNEEYMLYEINSFTNRDEVLSKMKQLINFIITKQNMYLNSKNTTSGQ